MAAVNLTGATCSPWINRTAGVSTTWQEYTLPDWARAVTVSVSAIARVAFDGAGDPAGTPEAPTDGGAVGSHYQTIAANTSYSFNRVGSLRSASIFIAAASGTVDVEIELEA